LPSSSESAAARALLSSAAVRERAHELLAAARQGGLPHWTLHGDRLPETAAVVAGVVRERYPDLDVPFHARWRHFMLGERDLWREAADAQPWDAAARARSAFDLAITSVLLDAGAGPDWRYQDEATGATAVRSRGWRWPACACSRPAPFRTSPAIRCVRTPLRCSAWVGRRWPAASRRARPIRWWASRAGRRCCAVWGPPRPAARTCSR
jgi:hypothetical protein